nr:PEP-CTERM sorting domain-containing protein [uncultured Rhodopila sp.]
MRHEPTVPDATTSPPCAAQWQPGHGRAILQISAATAALFGAPGLAMATPEFTPPAGVSDYRLLFVTADSTTASSADISTYNAFVTNEAAQNSALPATTWTAIVSTPTVNAVTNVDIGANGDANVPIYLVDGGFISSSANAFFGGSIPGMPAVDQFGNSNQNYVWTGSNSDGSAYAGYELGGSNGTGQGIDWISPSFVLSLYGWSDSTTSNTYPLYALSGEIDVPEPATGSALLVGGLIVTRVFRRRRYH